METIEQNWFNSFSESEKQTIETIMFTGKGFDLETTYKALVNVIK